MTYTVEQVIEGLSRYIDKNIYKGMNDVQELVARIVVGRAIQRSESIKDALVGNGFIRTFGIIDGDGMVDVDGIVHDLAKQISNKGSIELSIPMFGKLKFMPEDIDEIHRCIMEA